MTVLQNPFLLSNRSDEGHERRDRRRQSSILQALQSNVLRNQAPLARTTTAYGNCEANPNEIDIAVPKISSRPKAEHTGLRVLKPSRLLKN